MDNEISIYSLGGYKSYLEFAKQNPSDSDIGKIVYYYNIYEDELPKVLKGKRITDKNPSAATYNARTLDWNKDFKADTEHLPLSINPLNDDEEYLIFKAKKRPCLIIGTIDAIDVTGFPPGTQQNKAVNSFKKSYLLAPIFSCSNGTKTTSFGPYITAQIQALLYEQFFHIPKHPNDRIIKNDSIIRLDRSFCCRGLKTSDYIKLDNQVLHLIKQHLALFYNHKESISDDFVTLREMLKELYEDAYNI
jgi:hypothetical protein